VSAQAVDEDDECPSRRGAVPVDDEGLRLSELKSGEVVEDPHWSPRRSSGGLTRQQSAQTGTEVKSLGNAADRLAFHLSLLEKPCPEILDVVHVPVDDEGRQIET
jgi:hypothetical protein